MKYEFTPLLKFKDTVEEQQAFFYLQVSSGWSNNQNDQI